MHRRTLDIIFSAGAVVLAGLLLILGLVLQNQANFAKDYVHNQLEAQKITFTPAKFLAADENDPCLKANAGKPLVTGKQAECYANHYIAVHLSEVNNGKTYSETSNDQRAAAAAAKADPTNTQLATAASTLDGQVQTLFRGETLRGLLLTSYGFSIFGERAQQAAYVAYAVALVLFIASIAGFIHAFTTPKEEEVLVAHTATEA
jgi:hypothetical protein